MQCLRTRLPDELVHHIREHAAASTLQRAWLRHALYGHARRPGWPPVRAHLQRVGAWRSLVRYAAVRREWRTEAASWLLVDDPDVLAREAADGLWGAHTARLSP